MTEAMGLPAGRRLFGLEKHGLRVQCCRFSC